MNIKLVGVSVAELDLALKYSGLYFDADEMAIRAIPEFIRQKHTTLDMWEKIGEYHEREREANEKLAKIESTLRGDK